MSSALIIFIRNPEKGKVKTRLGMAIGDDAALDVYIHLCALTRMAVHDFPGTKYVFYSDEIICDDEWDPQQFIKCKQSGSDFGERMANAFKLLFVEHDRILIIGSDCPYLKNEHLIQAIQLLDEVDCVFGPATDGGYYLLGMRYMIPELFININWSTSSVLKESMEALHSIQASHSLLDILEDIDDIEDWERYQNSIHLERND